MSKWCYAWYYPNINLAPMPLAVPAGTQRVSLQLNHYSDRIKLLFSNVHGTSDLTLDEVWVSVTTPDAAQPVTVNGQSRIRIPAGGQLVSDEVTLTIFPDKRLLISTYLSQPQTLYSAVTLHGLGVTQVQHSLTTHNVCREASFDEREIPRIVSDHDPTVLVYGVSGVIADVADDVRSILCMGDSITHRAYWTEQLALRLYDTYPGKVSVLNSGISGNRILHDGATTNPFGLLFDVAAVNRLPRELATVRPDMLILSEGVNDLLHPGHAAPVDETVNADEILTGITKICEQAKAAGCVTAITTLVPASGYSGWTAVKEAERLQVNTKIRQSDIADAVFDFEQAIVDVDGSTLKAVYDCGDHLHPNAAGGIAMAQSIDLAKIATLLFD